MSLTTRTKWGGYAAAFAVVAGLSLPWAAPLQASAEEAVVPDLSYSAQVTLTPVDDIAVDGDAYNNHSTPVDEMESAAVDIDSSSAWVDIPLAPATDEEPVPSDAVVSDTEAQETTDAHGTDSGIIESTDQDAAVVEQDTQDADVQKDAAGSSSSDIEDVLNADDATSTSDAAGIEDESTDKDSAENDSTSDESDAVHQSNAVSGDKSFSSTSDSLPIESDQEALLTAISDQNGLVKDPITGEWEYLRDGQIDSSFTGLAKNQYGWWFVRNGKLDRDYVGFASNELGTWYVRSGQVDFKYSGMVKDSTGTWRYVVSGKAQLSYTGLAKNQYGWWYFEDGTVNHSFTGLIKNQNGWWFVRNGEVDWDHTGLASNELGTWYVRSGQVDFKYSGMVKDSTGTWRYVVSGKAQLSYTGLAKNQYGWWYFKDGAIDHSYTGLAKNQLGTWYIRSGQVDFKYNGMARDAAGTWRYVVSGKTHTGLAKNQQGWCYFKDGLIDYSYTGLAKNQNGWWFVRNGKVDWSYTGLAKNQNGWWFVRNGKLDWNHTGLVKNQWGWWYVRHGQLDRSFTGLAKNQWGTWYVRSGQIDYKYSGMYWDKRSRNLYQIKNGKLTSQVTADAAALRRSWNTRIQMLSFLNYAYEKIGGTSYSFGLFVESNADMPFRPSIDADAFNITHIEKDLEAIDAYNQWRMSIGLNPQKVTPRLMTLAMINTNYGAANMGHNPAGNVSGENLAWGGKDISDGPGYIDSNGLFGSLSLWYSEKYYYERFIRQHPELGDPAAELIATANLDLDNSQSHGDEKSDREKVYDAMRSSFYFSLNVTEKYGPEVMNNMGHYLNMLKHSSYNVAFAASTASSYGSTAGMVWDDDDKHAVTTDEMRHHLQQWRKVGKQYHTDKVRHQARYAYEALQKAKAGTYREDDLTPQQTIARYGSYNAMMKALNQAFDAWSTQLTNLIKSQPGLFQDGDNDLIQ